MDTAGAFPGVEAKERGQAEAIARSIEACLEAPVPFVATIIGEGGSGGAIAVATANKVLMLEHSVYAVISPEGCAAILWSDGTKGEQAAEALKPTAKDIIGLGVIDEIIKEPVGGAHRDHGATAANLREAIIRHLAELDTLAADKLVETRYEKFRAMTRCIE